MSQRMHLVLSAGGVRVVSYVGAIATLEEAGFEFASVSSCSAGTLVGALVATGMKADELEHRTLDLDLEWAAGRKRFLGFLNMLLARWPISMYVDPRLPEAFCKMVGGDPCFRDLAIPFSTAGIDIISNRLLVYSGDTHPDMPVSQAVRIATGAPLLYPPYEDGARVVVDLAIASQSPVWLATSHGDDLPIVVLRPRRERDTSKPTGFGAFLGRSIAAGASSLDGYMIRRIPKVQVVDIDCGTLSANDFTGAEKKKKTLVQRGRDACEEALERMETGVLRMEPELPESTSDGDRAEAEGFRRMADFGSSRLWKTRDLVFISYAHADRPWRERLVQHLQPRMRYGELAVWDDTEIRPGERWRPVIRNALERTRVAVLLVTPAFWGSKFIAQNELAYFDDPANRRDVTILWVPIEHSDWPATPLHDIQAARDPGEPLAGLSTPEQNRALVDICERIQEAMRR